MNRIYQGRVSSAELIDENGQPLLQEGWDGLAALWDHHALFQDAVNYYVVCLLALAQRGNDVFPIREKLDARDKDGNDDELMVWRPFRRRGAMRRGLRDSVAPYLCPGKPEATPQDCFDAVLAGNECALTEEGRKRLDAGLRQLLSKCTGAAGCKQSAPVFLPRFCKPDYQGNYGADSTTLARGSQEARLPFVVHDPTTRPDSDALNEFDVHSVALPNEKKPHFQGAEAESKLKEWIAEWEKQQPQVKDDWDRLRDAVSELPEDIQISGYAGTSAKGSETMTQNKKLRLYAMFFFRYLEKSDFTLGLLRATTKKPEPKEVMPELPAFSAGEGDPIRLARGARKYVFRAFTSLPGWGGKGDGAPEWIEFDFAAFEEALKTLNQISSKKKERTDQQAVKLSRLEYQRQCTFGKKKEGEQEVYDLTRRTPARKSWKGEKEGEDEKRPPVLAGDPRLARLETLVDVELKDEYEMSEGVSVKYGLHQRTIRGFRDVRKKWNDFLDEKATYTPELRQKLWEMLTDYKKDNAQTMGSPAIFDAMVEEADWIIWREPSVEQVREWRKAAALPEDAEFANDVLQALTDERELIEEIERLNGPIRFTPADPEHSRRQFYFSDVSALDKKGRLRHDRQTVQAEVAVLHEGRWQKRWMQMAFSAPRLLRDQLNNTGGVAPAWQQAMMVPLDLKTGLTKKGKAAKFEDCAAVALMPEVAASGERRILLNFPLTLDGEAIAEQLGKAARWDALQFGGADKESYWLRWPGTWIDEKKERKKAPPAPWWKSKEPWQCLSVDLGQRDAGAFALLEATPGDAPKPQSRKIGTADGRDWWATVRATGLLRLPGEDAQVMRDEKWQQELYGERGRMASDAEWSVAREICARLGLKPDVILGTERDRYSFPEMNDRLLFALRRAQGRLARLQSWSCIESNEKRKQAIINQLRTAVEELAETEEGERDGLLVELKPLFEKEAWAAVAGRLIQELEKLRGDIPRELVRIANRIQPLRNRSWEWALREDKKNYLLRQTLPGTDDSKKLLAGQRGLSMERIEQLELLRQRCQSLNRALQQVPGQPAGLGRGKRGIELPDPCPELLERLEALKEQRVNQTAHLILAQALGVRLKAHAGNKAERAQKDIHGEYEIIPGRRPVDFLVLENLDRYLSSQGRGRAENSKLMKWSHRAILDKLEQLCEPYGLRVLETPAAYSSRFCSLTGAAGFRAAELTPECAQEFRWRKHLERLADPERAKKLDKEERRESDRVKTLFEMLNEMNADLLASKPERPKWRTLLAPVAGGPMFIPASEMEWYDRAREGKMEKAFGFCEVNGRRPVVAQADINAAINLGLRAIAAPEMADIHVRVRAQRAGESFAVRAENKREMARWGAKPPEISVAEEKDRTALLAEAKLNFFADVGRVADYDRAEISGDEHYASGRGIWGTIKGNKWHDGKDWKRVLEINRARFDKWRRKQDDDNIPM